MVHTAFEKGPEGPVFFVRCSCGLKSVVRVGAFYETAELRGWATFCERADQQGCDVCRAAVASWRSGDWARARPPSASIPERLALAWEGVMRRRGRRSSPG